MYKIELSYLQALELLEILHDAKENEQDLPDCFKSFHLDETIFQIESEINKEVKSLC